jgi:mono/diheme cytochrome c family protein
MLLSLALAACGTSDTSEGADISDLVGDASAGEVIYEKYCLECHSIDDKVNIAGPSFYGAGDRLTYDYVEESMRDPHKVEVYVDDPQKPDEEMPTDLAEELTEQEFADVIAYILSLTAE